MAIRSVHFAAQAELERESFRPDVAVISITVPDAETAVLADFRYLLRLAFHDVEAGDTPWIWFDRDHARLVVDFIDTIHALPDPIDLLVHCKAGISRSAAVALWVHAYLDEAPAFPKRRFAGFANRTVLQVLTEVSGKPVAIPRALTRNESFTVAVTRDFAGMRTDVCVTNARTGASAEASCPIGDEGKVVGQLMESVAGIANPAPAHQIVDWDTAR